MSAMEFVFAGLFLVISSVLLRKSRNHRVSGKASEKGSTEFSGGLFLGGIVFCIGAVGLALGTYSFSLGRRELILLFFLAFALNVQARLLNLVSKSPDQAAGLFEAKTNGITTLKKAFSIGLLPRGGDCSVLVNVIQTFQIACLVLVIFR